MALLLLCLILVAIALAADKKANVLFVVVDDLAPVLSTYGYPVISPNLERLKKVSTQFRNAYVSIAVCAPSRTGGWSIKFQKFDVFLS
jgi:hypothetical protein